jgi:DNA-binding response OmpR family regulator
MKLPRFSHPPNNGYLRWLWLKRIVLILSSLDLGLPGFATGAAVLKHMRSFPSVALIPVIVLTGRDSRVYEQPMLELGAAGLTVRRFVSNFGHTTD